MIITTTNKRKKDTTKSKIVKRFASWCLPYLLGDKECKNLTVNIIFTGYVKTSGYDSYGYVEPDDIDNPTEFDVHCAAELSMTRTLRVIAHEMVHIKQYVRGELKDCNNPNYALWKRKRINLNEIKYYFLPWEVEAFGLECSLVYEWVNEKNLEKEPWFNYRMVI